MSHIISLKATKFQQPLLITLGVADGKPEGGQKAPPPPPPAEDKVKEIILTFYHLQFFKARLSIA